MVDALVGAYRKSGALERQRALLRAADEDVALSVAALRPVIGYSLEGGHDSTVFETPGPDIREDSRDVSPLTGEATFQMLLRDGGASRASLEAARQSVLAVRQTLLRNEQTELLRAVSAYLELLRQQENVALRESHVGLMEEEVRNALERLRFGESDRADVALSESRAAAADAALARAQGELSAAREVYFEVVGTRPDRLVADVPLPRAPDSVEAALEAARRDHPEMNEARFRVSAASLLVDRADRSVRPRLSVLGSAGAQDNTKGSDDSRNASIGIRLEQELYSGGANGARRRQAVANHDAEMGALHDANARVEREVRTAFGNLDAVERTVEASRKRVEAAEVAVQTVRAEAAAGFRTLLDVLNLEQELADARVAEIGARVDRRFVRYQMLAAQGLLTAEALRLPVRLYDPEAYYEIVAKAPIRFKRVESEVERALEQME